MKFEEVVATVNERLPDGRIFCLDGPLLTGKLPLPVRFRSGNPAGRINSVKLNGNQIIACGEFYEWPISTSGVPMSLSADFDLTDDNYFESDGLKITGWTLVSATLIGAQYSTNPPISVLEETRDDR